VSAAGGKTVGWNTILDWSVSWSPRSSRAITLDPREFAGGRWWTTAEIAAADPDGFEPHLGRFIAKARFRTAGDAAAFICR
jgi:hypothetical protein